MNHLQTPTELRFVFFTVTGIISYLDLNEVRDCLGTKNVIIDIIDNRIDIDIIIDM